MFLCFESLIVLVNTFLLTTSLKTNVLPLAFLNFFLLFDSPDRQQNKTR